MRDTPGGAILFGNFQKERKYKKLKYIYMAGLFFCVSKMHSFSFQC